MSRAVGDFLGIIPRGTTIAGALSVVDEDGSGSLDFEEFVQLLLIYSVLAAQMACRSCALQCCAISVWRRHGARQEKRRASLRRRPGGDLAQRAP